MPFEWRLLSKLPAYASGSSSEFNDAFTQTNSLCEIRFHIKRAISGPVFEYYRLSNYYQNQRLYVKSVDWEQLRGEALPAASLTDCAPLIGPSDNASLVYYPCGLIANSMFNDTIGGLVADDTSNTIYQFPPKDISWSSDRNRYGPSKYSVDQVRPPPFWASNRRLVNPDGKYKTIPDLQNDERFQNWMRVAGLPTFRKTYGRHNSKIPLGNYKLLIASTYEVQSYGARKAVVISNTSWVGGKNPFLGYAYIVTGSVFLLFAIGFLIRHLVAPRRLGDPNYLSWNLDDPSTTPTSQ